MHDAVPSTASTFPPPVQQPQPVYFRRHASVSGPTPAVCVARASTACARTAWRHPLRDWNDRRVFGRFSFLTWIRPIQRSAFLPCVSPHGRLSEAGLVNAGEEEYSLVEHFAHCQPEGDRRRRALRQGESGDLRMSGVIGGQDRRNTTNTAGEPYIARQHAQPRGHERDRTVGHRPLDQQR